MLEHLGLEEAARKIEEAVIADLSERTGTRSTAEVGDAVAARVAG
jgi:3-isopropylmalate dehydrogenase